MPLGRPWVKFFLLQSGASGHFHTSLEEYIVRLIRRSTTAQAWQIRSILKPLIAAFLTKNVSKIKFCIYFSLKISTSLWRSRAVVDLRIKRTVRRPFLIQNETGDWSERKESTYKICRHLWIYRAKFPLSCLPRLYAIPYGRSHIGWNVHRITPWLCFAMLEHMRTCSFPNLKNHYKTQHMMASIFAVWESGKTGEARTARKIRARQHLTSCHYSRYDGGHVQSNSSNASTQWLLHMFSIQGRHGLQL